MELRTVPRRTSAIVRGSSRRGAAALRSRRPRRALLAILTVSLCLVVLAPAFLSALHGVNAAVHRQPLAVRAGRTVVAQGDVVPLRCHVLVRLSDTATTSKSGLSVVSKDKPQHGVVVAVGPGEADSQTGIVESPFATSGESVMYSKWTSAEPIEVNGIEHVIIRDDDILVSFQGPKPVLESLRMPPGRVLVRVPHAEGTTEAGLILPTSVAKKGGDMGEVVAVGAGLTDGNGEEMVPDVGIGDTVWFLHGDEVKLDNTGATYLSVKLSSCTAKQW